MLLLVRTVRQHDEYFASIVALAAERVRGLESKQMKEPDSAKDVSEYILSMH